MSNKLAWRKPNACMRATSKTGKVIRDILNGNLGTSLGKDELIYMGLLKEFKEFAMKGSVVDLAVAVVIGGAFGKIVSSLVNDIIMPPLGLLMGGVDFSNKVLELRPAQTHLDTAKNI